MSKQPLIGVSLLVVVGLAIGLGAGHWFFGLYVDSIPEALKASTSMTGTRLVFLLNGLFLGLLIAVWSLVAVLASRFFRSRERETYDSKLPPI